MLLQRTLCGDFQQTSLSFFFSNPWPQSPPGIPPPPPQHHYTPYTSLHWTLMDFSSHQDQAWRIPFSCFAPLAIPLPELKCLISGHRLWLHISCVRVCLCTLHLAFISYVAIFICSVFPRPIKMHLFYFPACFSPISPALLFETQHKLWPWYTPDS